MEDGKKKMKWGSKGSKPEIAELCVNLCKLMNYSSFVKPLNSPWLPYYFPPFMEALVAKNCHVANKDERQRNNAKNVEEESFDYLFETNLMYINDIFLKNGHPNLNCFLFNATINNNKNCIK